jgi:hypothetical protein
MPALCRCGTLTHGASKVNARIMLTVNYSKNVMANGITVQEFHGGSLLNGDDVRYEGRFQIQKQKFL